MDALMVRHKTRNSVAKIARNQDRVGGLSED